MEATKYAVCPRIERSATRRPKVFDSLSDAQAFLGGEAQFPLDDQELVATHRQAVEQDCLGAWRGLLVERGDDPSGLSFEEFRNLTGEPAEYEPLRNESQGWGKPVPVSRAAQYVGAKCCRSFREFLPLTEVSIMPKVTDEAEVRRALHKWNPAKPEDRITDDYTCYLGEEWHFDDIEADAWRRPGHGYSGRQHGSIAEIAVKAIYDLEAALWKYHPNASPAALADFWQSWEVQHHVGHFCWDLGDSDTARLLAGDHSVVEGERIRWYLLRQLAVFAHEVGGVGQSTQETPQRAVPETHVTANQKNINSKPYRFKRKDDELENIRKLVRQMRGEEASHQEICERLNNSPRPPHAKWRILSWPKAYLKYNAAVKRWLSSCK